MSLIGKIIFYRKGHYVMNVQNFILSVQVIWWNSYWAHTLFLVACSCVSFYNGSTFYFEIFVHRYLNQIGMQPKPPKPKKAA